MRELKVEEIVRNKKDNFVSPREAMVKNDGKSKESIEEFVFKFNKELDNINDADCETLTKFCLLLLTEHEKEEINEPLFNMLNAYIKRNIGELTVVLSPKLHVRQIRLGKIKMGSLIVREKSYSNQEQSVPEIRCGYYPTPNDINRMFLDLNGKRIMGNSPHAGETPIERDNIVIGDYYLNRNTITGSNATLTRLELNYDKFLREDIYCFNDEGIVDYYSGILTLEKFNDKNDNNKDEYVVKDSIPLTPLADDDIVDTGRRRNYGISSNDKTSSVRIK